MKVEKWKIIIVIFFLIIPAYTYTAPGKRITWQPVAGAWGYHLELKDSQNNIIIRTTIKNNFFPVSGLESGTYSFRISTINTIKQKGMYSPWMNFAIEKLYIPELKSVSRRVLIIAELNKNTVIIGNNFRPESRFLLRGNGNELLLTDVELRSGNEAVIKYRPDKSSEGIYDLVVVNRGNTEAVLTNAIEISSPVLSAAICYIGMGYSVNIPLGLWAQYYTHSFAGAGLYFQFSGINMGLEHTLFEIELDSAVYKNGDSSKKSSLSNISLGIGSGYYYPVINDSCDLFLKFQGGIIYTYITLDEKINDKVHTTIDFFSMAGTGLRVRFHRDFFIEGICGWKTIFYSTQFFHDIKLSLSFGLKL